MNRPVSIGQGSRLIVQLEGQLVQLRKLIVDLKEEKATMAKRLTYFEKKFPHPYEDEL